MGKPVTIDSDDLETLLYSAGAMKHIEQALYAAKHDFLYDLAKPKIAGVADRVNHERLKAPAYERPVVAADLQPADQELIRHLFRDEEGGLSTPMIRVGPGDDMVVEDLHNLREFGLVEMGVIIAGVRWAANTDLSDAKDGSYALRLTGMGQNVLSEILQKKAIA